MDITRAMLGDELASLERQEAEVNEAIAKAEAVKQDNTTRLFAIRGARAMVLHMIQKLEQATASVESPPTVVVTDAKEVSDGSGDQGS